MAQRSEVVCDGCGVVWHEYEPVQPGSRVMRYVVLCWARFFVVAPANQRGMVKHVLGAGTEGTQQIDLCSPECLLKKVTALTREMGGSAESKKKP